MTLTSWFRKAGLSRRASAQAKRPRRQFRPRLEPCEERVLLTLDIVPTFAANITSDPNAAIIMDSINRVIAAYESAISDNITINITFQEGGGLGGSSTFYNTVSYSAYRAALASHATSADDTTALASLPNSATRPVDGTSTQTGTLINGSNTVAGLSETRSLAVGQGVTGTGIPGGTTIASIVNGTTITLNNNATTSGTSTLTFQSNNNVNLKTALIRALGLSGGSVATDSTITLNTAICNLSRTGAQDPAKYDLMAVTAHEIDEAIGYGSALDGLLNGDGHRATISADDLFRYDQAGARSYDTNAATQAFFSIDGGATQLARFNQFSQQSQVGDFGDWFSTGPHTPQVQDAFGTAGATQNLGVEIRRLDVLGYALSALHAPTLTAAATQSAVEGAAKSFDLGSFTDPDASPWGVVVSWGDGSPDTPFFVNDAGALGTKPHTYSEEGSYTVTVTVTDFTNQTSTTTFTVNASDPAVIPTGGFTVNAAEGAAFSNQTVATFTDPAGPELSPSVGAHYSADINWGDGTAASAGSIIYSGGGVFTVRGSHMYAEEGTYPISVTIHHETAPDATTTSIATVSDPAVIPTGGLSLATARGAPLCLVTVATFTDPGGAEPNPSDPSGVHYTADIDWGDGTPSSAGTVSFSGTPGSKTAPFTVTGDHTYTTNGTYTITVTIHHELAPDAVTTGTATVSSVAIGQGPCDANTLLIGGTLGADTIRVTPRGSSGDVQVLINGEPAVIVPASSFSSIAIYAQAGDDDVQVDPSVVRTVFAFGGAGDDRLKGGGGNNLLVGGSGDDRLIGGSTLSVLIGGTGADTLIAQGADDVLIGGTVDFEDPSTCANNMKLCDLLGAWAAPSGYGARAAAVTALLAGHASDDGAADVLNGGPGLDLFFVSAGDLIRGNRKGEIVVTI
jgi:hypothetical protein